MFWQISPRIRAARGSQHFKSRHLEVVFKEVGGIEPAHAPQDAEQALGGGRLPVPRLPQHQQRLRGARPCCKVADVAVDVEPLCQHPPVVADGDRGVQHPGEGLLGLGRQPPGGSTFVGAGGRGGAEGRPLGGQAGVHLQRGAVGVAVLADGHGEGEGAQVGGGVPQRERAVERWVVVRPEVGEGHLLKIRTSLHGPTFPKSIEAKLQGSPRSRVLEQAGSRTIKESTTKLPFGPLQVGLSSLAVLDAVQPDCEVSSLWKFLSEGGNPEALERGGRSRSWAA